MADRLLQAKQDLSQIRTERGGLLRATYAAVRGDMGGAQGAAARGDGPTTTHTAAAPAATLDEMAVLGSDGPFRVSAALPCPLPTLKETVMATAEVPHYQTHAVTGMCLLVSR